MRERKVLKYTRRAIPEGFSIALPRQACPECGILIDVRIKKNGIFLINTHQFRSHDAANREHKEMGGKGGYSEPDE